MPSLKLEDFLLQRETEPASEYACGRVRQKPMPDREHAAIQIFLGATILQFLARTDIGQVFTEFRCIFGPPDDQRTYVPDVSYVAREHLTADRYLYRAPDLAVEVLSPDQHTAEFESKVQFYLQDGVRLVWVVDPRASTVTVEEPEKMPRVLRGGDVLDGGPVLPGFTLAVDDILARTRV
jgi:Uma2 family endonuclease